MRVAAVDLGTNSTRLLVADANGTLDEVVRRLVITRLGEGVDERRRLLPLPIARVRNVLSDFRRELEALGAERTLCIATSAVRDAENGEAFLGEIEWSYGFTTRLLTGDEEAKMTLRGIGAVDPGTLVADIGGGSTELQVVGDGVRVSLDVGCVRMTERFGEDVEAVRAHVRALLPEASPSRAVGVAGTVTTLAALDLGLAEYDPEQVHGHVIPTAAVGEQTARLAALPLEERARLVQPGRAPVIVAGGAILAELLAFYGLEGIEASERDILHGAALAAAELPEPEEGAAGRPAPTPAAESLLGLSLDRLGQRLVLGQSALQHGPGEDADEASLLDHGDAVEILLLEEAERLVEGQLGADHVLRHLDDLAQPRRARVAPGRDHLAHERLARDDAEQPAVFVADEEHAHLRATERLARLLGARAAVQHRRVGHHRVAHLVHQPIMERGRGAASRECRGRESNPHGREAGRF